MLTNDEFLDVIRESFGVYLRRGTSRSNAKLRPLHGAIARDLEELYGRGYTVESLGYGFDRELTINGKYYPKAVDITVLRHGLPAAGYAVKFVTRNYAQNSNNYFENMLGETANLRAAGIPYFQIFITLDAVPYYNRDGRLLRYEQITGHNLSKYHALSTEDPAYCAHTPDSTLLTVVHLETAPRVLRDAEAYADYYLSVIDEPNLLDYSGAVRDTFGGAVILNDYHAFLIESVGLVKGLEP